MAGALVQCGTKPSDEGGVCALVMVVVAVVVVVMGVVEVETHRSLGKRWKGSAPPILFLSPAIVFGGAKWRLVPSLDLVSDAAVEMPRKKFELYLVASS